MQNKHYLDNLWRWKCGLHEKEQIKPNSNLISDLEKTEWSPDFEKMMRNRLVMGALRYGKMGHGSNLKGKPTYNRCDSIRKRLKFFEDTGSAEWLVDIANMALLMFEERQHKDFNFKTEDDGFHDSIIKH